MSTGASTTSLLADSFVLRSMPVLPYSSHRPSTDDEPIPGFCMCFRFPSPSCPTSSQPTPRPSPATSPALRHATTVHSTASHASADAWQMPLQNKDRLFLVLLPSSSSYNNEEWAFLLSPKRERKGHKESTLFRLMWEEGEKGLELVYRSRGNIDPTSMPILARWLLLKVRPGQAEFFDDEFDGVAVVQDKEWGSRGWVGSCLARLRHVGFEEVMQPEDVMEEVKRWMVSTWERGPKAKVGEVVADLRLRG